MEASLVKYRKHLAILWFAGAGVLFVAMLIMDWWGIFGGKAQDAWGWLLPSIVPTLSIIIGSFAKGESQVKTKPDKFTYKLSLALSSLYLLTLFVTLLIQRFLPGSISVMEVLSRASWWVIPFQGLVSGSLAAFFVKS